jgi:hypothetical protein
MPDLAGKIPIFHPYRTVNRDIYALKRNSCAYRDGIFLNLRFEGVFSVKNIEWRIVES